MSDSKFIRNIKVSLIAAAGVIISLTSSCAPKVIPTARIVPEIHKTVSVAPRAIVVKEKVAQAQVTAGDLNTGIQRALDEADRLRNQKSASAAELTNMWSILTKEKEHAADLFKQLGEAKSESKTLAGDAVAKDAEVSELRIANTTLSAQVAQAAKNETIASSEIKKLTKKAGVYDFVMNKVWIIFGLAIAWALIRFVLPIVMKALNPIPKV